MDLMSWQDLGHFGATVKQHGPILLVQYCRLIIKGQHSNICEFQFRMLKYYTHTIKRFCIQTFLIRYQIHLLMTILRLNSIDE